MQDFLQTRSISITTSEKVARGKPQTEEATLCYGLLRRKLRWGFSATGWSLVLLTLALAVSVLSANLLPFLTLTAPVKSHVLVVEGWIPDYAIRAAVSEFERGQYTQVVATGGPVKGTGPHTNDYNTSASVGGSRLIAFGLPPDKVNMVPCRVIDRDRTFSAALALRQWFLNNGGLPSSLNVLTAEAHARRTRLLFQEAFGRSTAVGIICVPNPEYDSRRWWRYSEGVREVVGEAIAYVYAKIFFYPSLSGSDTDSGRS